MHRLASACLHAADAPPVLLPVVLLPTAVKGVTDKGSSVSVTLANGTELTADYVIVTVPLGVLKEGVIKFTPPLPADKQTAIKNMVSRRNLHQHKAARWPCCFTTGRALFKQQQPSSLLRCDSRSDLLIVNIDLCHDHTPLTCRHRLPALLVL
jgi:hypothetical protein